MTSARLRYRRRPGCVSRALHDHGWVGRSGQVTIALEQSALLVWVALEAERSVDELATAIRHTWPELGRVQESEVQEALDALVEHGIVDALGGPADTAGEP